MKTGVMRLVLAGLPLLLCRCAHEGAPGGGPEDKAPPAVIESFPVTGSLNVPLDQEIRFTLSEWIRPEQAERAVFVSPARPRMKVKVSGRTVRLTRTAPLLDGMTYVVTLGTGLRDLRDNPLAASQTLSFSTGAFLDTGRIGGRACDQTGQRLPAGASIFAYRMDDTAAADPLKDDPTYVTQTAADGAFKLQNLKTGRYRLFCVTDQNGNLRFDPGREMIALPASEAVLSGSSPFIDEIELFAMRRDTLRLALEKASLKPSKRILVIFNRPPLASSALDPRNYSLQISDTTIKAPVPAVVSVLPFPLDSLRFLVYCSEPLKERRYKLRVSALTTTDLIPLDTGASVSEFAGLDGPDSIAPALTGVRPADNAAGIGERDSLHLYFSEPIRSRELSAAFSLALLPEKEGDTVTPRVPVAGRGIFEGPMAFAFVPDSGLLPGRGYLWRFPGKGLVDEANNCSPDSAVSGRFSILETGTTGSISGTVEGENPDGCRVRAASRGGGKILDVKPDHNGYFALAGLPEGAYRVTAYRDADNDGRWGTGRLAPFAFSEKGTVASDSLFVRKRWEVEGIKVRMK